jgi:arylsulfatase A-like enzyme
MRERPNLVFILSDQQSRDMLGAYGLSQVQTPSLDALARDGILFDHCVASAPVCTPHRSMLLSGQHPLWNNCFTNDRRLLTDIGESFAQVLGRAGYRNGYVGKWHLYGGDRDRPVPPGPDRHGFDDLFATNNCHLNYDPDHAFFWDEQGRKQLFGTWEAEGQTEQALSFIDGQERETPFSLFVSYHAPHNHFGGEAETYSEYDAPERFKALYDVSEIRPRPTSPDNDRFRRMYLGHMAMCSEVDYHVGRILSRLHDRGLMDNTIVVYTSDHGDTFGAYSNHWHKGSPEDVSVRVPLLLRLPDGLGAGRRSQLLVGTLDLMPTLLGLMGIEPPSVCQGSDLSQPIRDAEDDIVESVPLFYFSWPWRGLYTRRWTYSVENIDRRGQALEGIPSDVHRNVLLRGFNTLYDREEDPHQLYNLYGHDGYECLQRDLHERTAEWLERFGDPFPTQTELAESTAGRGGRPIDHLQAALPPLNAR